MIVKLWPGKSEVQKRSLSDAIVRHVTGILSYDEESVSVRFEEVPSNAWSTQVYERDIQANWKTLTKEPGYRPGPKSVDESE